MKELKNIGKGLAATSLAGMLAVAGMAVPFASANDSTSAQGQTSYVSDAQIESTSDSNSDSNDSQSSTNSSSVERNLTSDEIDKIIDDLKVSGNVDNILTKLDEIIKRAELSGNDSLKEYAQNLKSKYELQKQIDSLNSLIEAMKKKNSDIESLDTEINKILSVNTILEDLQGALSDEALMVLETLDEKSIGKLQEVFAEIEGLVDLNDIGALSVKQRSLLDVLMLNEALSQNMFEGHRLQVAQEALSVAVTLLKSYEKQKYSDSEYNTLVEKSEQFANTGKKTQGVFPEQVVFMDGAFNLNYAPVMYNGHILVAIDDLYQYIDASVDYMYNNATLVIQSPGNTLEITSGKNVAYLNDQPKNMPAAVMNIDNTIYISAEFFAQTYNISYRYISDLQTIVMYKNLNQLSEPSIPNQINRE